MLLGAGLGNLGITLNVHVLVQSWYLDLDTWVPRLAMGTPDIRAIGRWGVGVGNGCWGVGVGVGLVGLVVQRNG